MSIPNCKIPAILGVDPLNVFLGNCESGESVIKSRQTLRKGGFKTVSQPWIAHIIGKLLAALPAPRLLYPLYLARQLETVEEEYASALLPKAFDGLKIAYASDIHYGSLLKEDRVRALAQRINAMQADIVLLGGDYGEDSPGAIRFFQLHPGFQAGIAVLGAIGNHDRKPPDDLPGLMDEMKKEGVIPVCNDAWILERQGSSIAFASTDDFFLGEPDYIKTAQSCRNADFTVYFPHNPDSLPETYGLFDSSFYQLALCGHTHGGQVAVKRHAVISSSLYGSRFLSGWYRENGADIMVSNGVGTSKLPVRLGAVPQIHCITLRRKEQQESSTRDQQRSPGS